MTSARQINSLPRLLAVKMIRQQISLTNRLTHQSTNEPPTSGGNDKLVPNTADFRVDHHL